MEAQWLTGLARAVMKLTHEVIVISQCDLEIWNDKDDGRGAIEQFYSTETARVSVIRRIAMTMTHLEA